MKSIHFRDKIGGVILAFAIIFGIGVASSLTAHAQWRDDDQYRRDRDWRRNRDRDDDYYQRERERERARRDEYYRRNGGYNNGSYGTYGTYGGYGGYGGYNNIYRVAQNQGYQDGLYTGSSDAQRGQSYNPQRSHYYKDGTSGYNSSYGNKGQYKQAYRDGFLQGYDQGFRRYGGYGGYGNNGSYRRSRAGSVLGTIFGRP
jgi:hypothetical protein